MAWGAVLTHQQPTSFEMALESLPDSPLECGLRDHENVFSRRVLYNRTRKDILETKVSFYPRNGCTTLTPSRSPRPPAVGKKLSIVIKSGPKQMRDIFVIPDMMAFDAIHHGETEGHPLLLSDVCKKWEHQRPKRGK
jgi:hypothetical protein